MPIADAIDDQLTPWERFELEYAVEFGFLTVSAHKRRPYLLRAWNEHCTRTRIPYVVVTKNSSDRLSLIFDTTTTAFVPNEDWNDAVYAILYPASPYGATVKAGAVPTSDRLTRTSAPRAAKQLLDLFRAQHPQQVAEPVNA